MCTRWSSPTRWAKPTRCCGGYSTAASGPAAPRRRSARSPTTPTTPTRRSGRRAGAWSPNRARRSARAGRCSPASPATRPALTTTICRPIGLRAVPSRWPARAPGASSTCSLRKAEPSSARLGAESIGECNCSTGMRLLRSAMAGALVLLAFVASAAGAKTIQFDGDAVRVPSGWPVYRLAEHPQMCVRLDRRAVYLGTPGAQQRCPSEAIGRQQAIVVDPSAQALARAQTSAVAPPAPVAAGSDDYTGLGFDACAAPSSRTMSAWASSPYRAIGVYIGGSNRACSQPNLTSTWVGEQVADGWHLIPTYVGLQAPTSACTSCAMLSSSKATAQGIEAADDAVADAQGIGMGAGSPIYFDMEA